MRDARGKLFQAIAIAEKIEEEARKLQESCDPNRGDAWLPLSELKGAMSECTVSVEWKKGKAVIEILATELGDGYKLVKSFNLEDEVEITLDCYADADDQGFARNYDGIVALKNYFLKLAKKCEAKQKECEAAK
jgi:hypothetical protein